MTNPTAKQAARNAIYGAGIPASKADEIMMLIDASGLVFEWAAQLDRDEDTPTEPDTHETLDRTLLPVVDLSNVEAGLVVVNGRQFIPGPEYEEEVAKMVEAQDRLTALRKAAEFIPPRNGGLIPLVTPELRAARNVVDAADWVLNGAKGPKTDD